MGVSVFTFYYSPKRHSRKVVMLQKGLRLFDIIITFLVRSWPLSVSRVKIKYLFCLICSTASWPSTADTWSPATSKCSGRSSASTSSKERASPSTASTRPSSRGLGRERERRWEEERDRSIITGYYSLRLSGCFVS